MRKVLLLWFFVITLLPLPAFARDNATTPKPSLPVDYEKWDLSYQNSCRIDEQNQVSEKLFLKMDGSIFEVVSPNFANGDLVYTLYVKGTSFGVELLLIYIPEEGQMTAFDAMDPMESFLADALISDTFMIKLKTNPEILGKACQKFQEEGDEFIRDFLEKLKSK